MLAHGHSLVLPYGVSNMSAAPALFFSFFEAITAVEAVVHHKQRCKAALRRALVKAEGLATLLTPRES